MKNSFSVRSLLRMMLPQPREQSELRQGRPVNPWHRFPVFWNTSGAQTTAGLRGEMVLAAEMRELFGRWWRQPPAQGGGGVPPRVMPEKSWRAAAVERSWCGSALGWPSAEDGGAEKRQRCHVSSVTLISPSLFNVLVNQDLDQNREFSGAVKIFSQILPFAWPGELKERSSRGAPKWFCRTPFSRMVSSANESLPLFHKMGINKPSAIRIMFFKAVGWKTLYKSKASFWYMCFGLNVRITTGGERLLTDVSQQNSPIYLFPR